MRRLLAGAVTLILLATAACSAADSAATNGAEAVAEYRPDEAERAQVIAVVEQFFDALRTGDADLLRSMIDESVVMHSSSTRDGSTTFAASDVPGLATRIASSEAPLIERMWDPIVMVDGPLATLWTPYDFYAGEQFSHCGVDSFILMNGEDGWKIVGLAWTRFQPPACDMHPDGPPTG